MQIALGEGGEIYLAWTQKLEKKYTGNIRFTRSLDGGHHFDEPRTVNDDGLEIGHRFPVLSVRPQGAVRLSWIDKRALESARAGNQEFLGASLYTAVSRDRGEHFEANQKLIDHSCECCRLAVANQENGHSVLLYRHVFPGNVRDHALMYIDESMASGAIQRISEDQWQIEGCPHHGPAIASAGGTEHLAWFTGGQNRQGLFYAHASNRDGLFLVSHPQPFGLPGSERPSVAATGGEVVLAWKRFEHDRTRVYAQKSLDGGQSWQPAKVVAESLGGSDHPLLTVIDQQVFLSWKSDPEGYRLISSILTRSPYHEATHLMAFPGRHGGGQLGHSSFGCARPSHR